jgi:hypothetical protein
MMQPEPVSKTLVFNQKLMWLITQEDFMAFIHRETLAGRNF